MSTFVSLPNEVVELIIKKCFYDNFTLQTLNIVCKTITKIFDKYADKTKKEDFICKECYHESFSKTMFLKYDEQTGRSSYITVKICSSCNIYCGNHNIRCNYGLIKIRGIKGFCIYCLSYAIEKLECKNCGLEFMSSYSGKNPYCLKCLSKFKPEMKISPEWKQILPIDEPFCY